MKKIINFVLMIGSIVALGLAIKFSAVPIIKNLPSNVAQFLITTPEEQQQYILVYDIAVGFFLSALFYFIVDEIPEQIKLRRAKKIISKNLNRLLQDMNVIISLTTQFYECPKDIQSLAKKDFLILNGDVKNTSIEISYRIEVYEGKVKKPGTKAYGTLNEIIKSRIADILNQIKYIKQYEYLYAASTEFMEIIRNIESCDFVTEYQKKDKNSDVKCFLFGYTSEKLEKFMNLFLDLKRMKFHTQSSVVLLETEDKTEKYREDRESGKYIKNIIEIKRTEQDGFRKNPTLVVYADNYYSKIIKKEVEKQIKATFVCFNEYKADMISEYMYMVAIIDKKSSDRYREICQKIDKNIHLVLYVERNIINSIRYNWMAKQMTNIKGIYYYSTTRRIGRTPWYINRDEPSEQAIQMFIKDIKRIIIGT